MRLGTDPSASPLHHHGNRLCLLSHLIPSVSFLRPRHRAWASWTSGRIAWTKAQCGGNQSTLWRRFKVSPAGARNPVPNSSSLLWEIWKYIRSSRDPARHSLQGQGPRLHSEPGFIDPLPRSKSQQRLQKCALTIGPRGVLNVRTAELQLTRADLDSACEDLAAPPARGP